MAVHFENQTSNATSTPEVVDGNITVYIRGDFPNANIVLETRAPTKSWEEYRRFWKHETFNLFMAGEIRFVLIDANAYTNASVDTQAVT